MRKAIQLTPVGRKSARGVFETREELKRPPSKAAFFSRENSSNGSKAVKTFWKNLKRGSERVSRNF
jgi:hypothetical protein